MKNLTLSFFGTFQATLNSKPLTRFRSVKSQGLLIYLVVNGQHLHEREVLATLFWPEKPEKTAKQNLRQSLFRLRKALGKTDTQGRPFLLITHTTVQFNMASDHRLDVADFLAALVSGDLHTAVSLYQGDLLPGFTCDSLPFDDWLRQERERLHRLAVDSLYQLTADNLTQADFQEARRFAQKQLRLEPWREEAHRQLMQALAALGERTAALAQYETCRKILAEELGVDPAVETTNLGQRIREAQLARPASRQAPGNIERQRLKIPFVGRKAEYEILVNAYWQASRQSLQVVTVQGQAGIGKTRLTEQFVTWAATQGADVLYGRSFATSARLSYQPLIHLLRQRIERENAPEDLLSDLWLSQLTRLLPELRDRYPDLPLPTQDETTAKQHLFEAVTRLGLALAARQPLVLFIDDWHWADTASLDLLHYAVVRWAETKTPVLLLLTLRQEAVNASPDIQSWLKRLKHDVETIQIDLSELSQSETMTLIHALLASDEVHEHVSPSTESQSTLTHFNQWLLKETDGQPLFLTETLKTLVEDGVVRPDATTEAWQIDWSKFDVEEMSGLVIHGVREIIQGWLERISLEAKGVLTAVSVLAQGATFDLLCRVAALDETQAIEALDDLLSKQLLQEAEHALTLPTHDPIYSFYHQKVSEVIYTEAGAARRRLLHRRAFETLQTAASPAADLAHHALNAGLLAETIQYSLIAGNEAMDLFAVRVAITHYETIWQVAEQKGWPEVVSGADREALYTSLGRAYELIESWDKAQDVYQAMIAYAQSIGAAAMECLGLNRLATIVLIFNNDQQHAVSLLEQARMVAEQHGDQRGLAETEMNLSLAARRKGDQSFALHHAEQALSIARDLEHPQLLARCLTVLFYGYTMQRKWEKVEAYAIEASHHATAVGNLVLVAESQRAVGSSQMFLGRPQQSKITLQETLVFSRKIENLWGQAEGGRMLAHTMLELGDYGQAIRLIKQASRRAHMVGSPGLKNFTLVTWGTIQRQIMALDAAQKTLLELFAQFPEDDFLSFTKSWCLGELCALSALVGEWGQAHGYARQILQAQGDEPLLSGALTGWQETEALLRGGDEALAIASVARLGKAVGDNKRYRLILLRSQAVLVKWEGDVAQAVTHLEHTLTFAREMGLPGEEWPILGELGRLYAKKGEEVKAREAYEEAATIIHQLAETIDDAGLREGFVTAVPVRSILQQSKPA